MRFNPVTKKMYTNENLFLKKLECPYSISWQELSNTDQTDVKSCNLCNKGIRNTKNLSDEDVLELVRLDSNVCLKISLDQTNIRVVNHNV